MASKFSELERASLVVLDIFKTIPELQTAKVAIIGGMALWKYLPDYRTTQDVDFCITATGAPSSVKTKLLALPNTPFKQLADLFVYDDGKQLIQIDIVNTMQLPYLPSAAAAVNTIPTGFIPYVSEIDLIVYKIFACGLRPTAAKKQRDANDAYFLLEQQQGSLRLSSQQKECIAPALQDVITNGSNKTDQAWWKAKLGL
ncbi:hypothetical protein GMOD_00009504 [Pyrenophora seminiperda CCB06]|uniref:Uncharacterized protein n=1 Tax=Pyrenophora seminiperda CCB06 TaxID=1302712 RepID=A0A3M7MGR8_9PLEO|nr:hypothetical protein GMOD_00009504 [Pyrenophora seminiperda CCB06]